jgi:cardiolipin synthase
MSRRVRLLLRDNLRHRRDIERWYLVNISAARTEILIANAYFVPTYRFRQALLRATQRGVRVRLLIQGNSDQWWTHWATQALIGELVAGGVEVYEYTESFLHAKVAVIDDAVTVGSSNIDPFSLAFSLEANLIAEDVILANQLKQRLESAIYGASYRLQATRQPRGLLRSLGRAALITFALTALRVFIAFSGSSLRMR